MSGYSRLNIHAYSEAQLQDAAVAMGLCSDRDVVVTEVNQMAPSFYAPKLESMGCRESYWFILSGDGPENKPYHLMGSGYYADFRAVAQGIGQPPPLQGADGLPGASHDENEGGNMTEYSRARLWQDYQAVIEGTPMFQKVRAAHPELGEALGPERDYGDVRCQFYAGGIVWARIGDWANTAIVTAKDQLPLA